jgi:uncharacterized membrane protein
MATLAKTGPVYSKASAARKPSAPQKSRCSAAWRAARWLLPEITGKQKTRPKPVCAGRRYFQDHAVKKQHPLLHLAYVAVILVKAFDGAVETLLGLVIGLAGPDRIYDFIIRVTEPGLDLHPRAFSMLRHGAASLANAREDFIVFYLLVHGVLKLGLSFELLRGKSRWIYPVATTILGGFILFMTERLILHWSLWVLGFALFDALTVALVVTEWVSGRKKR